MEQPLVRWLPVEDTLGWGTTAAARRRHAPDPRAVALDDRGDADQIRFVQELAKLLLWPDPAAEGKATAPVGKPLDWQAFCCHP